MSNPIDLKRFFYIFFLFLSIQVQGQQDSGQASENITVPGFEELEGLPSDDSASVNPRSFDIAKIKALKNNSKYQYEKGSDISTNFIEKILKRIFDNINFKIPNYTGLDGIANIVTFIIIIVFIGFIIWLLTKAKFRSFLSGKKARLKENYDVFEEDIHAIDYEDEITAAVREKLYRKAVRLYYLKTLKHLSDHHYIEWKPNKTNRDYLTELSASRHRQHFLQVTQWFDYIWYGEFPVHESTFRKAEQDFKSMIDQLENQHTKPVK